MTDTRLRELERLFAQTKTVEDEAAVLRERLRLGVITEHAVRVASDHLHYPAARLALGPDTCRQRQMSAARLESELHVIPFTDGDGNVLPLGVLAASVLADEAACFVEANELTTGRLYRLIESVRNLSRSVMFQYLGNT